MSSSAPSPANILQIGLGFWASKTLLSAVEMEVFTELAKHPEDLATLTGRLGLHPRSSRDFFDALVALGFLERVVTGAETKTQDESPATLAALKTEGYLPSGSIVDAWGRPLRLTCPGRKDPEGYDLISDGPDAEMGALSRVE